MNRWNIPAWLEAEVIQRDRSCVYCGVQFLAIPTKRGQRPSWEHIVNDARIVTRESIARCCISCNASKGAKDLAAWVESRYCTGLGISESTVAPVVREAFVRFRQAS
jgi:5-methylcytosine-specific restriction endonuclease McrA